MTTAAHIRSKGRSEAGMSLVELMVGMMVGLIGIVIIAHLYITNEQYKRSTTGAGTAQANGAIALYTLERDIRMAGYGFNNPNAFGCTCAGAGCSPVQYYYSGTYSSPPGPSPSTLPPAEVVPVKITKTAGAPDKVTVLYGTADIRALPTYTTIKMGNPWAVISVDGVAGYNKDDIIFIANGSTCALMQITGAGGSTIAHGAGSPWNAPTGTSLLPAFDPKSYVFDLGAPKWRTYSVTNKALRMTESMPNPSAPTSYDLVDNIVDLRALYGNDTTATPDGTVDVWSASPPATADKWTRVIAIKIGVLSQSPNYVKPSVVGGNCDATTAAPKFADDTNAGTTIYFDAPDFTTATSQARCYKYRTFTTVVPLRNIIW